MAPRETKTERLIKEAARTIFLIEGRLHATTADIAREAGIPRTSLHYYFRSRDVLFSLVFEEALKDVTVRIKEVIESENPFRMKIETIVKVLTDESLRYPYLETFVVTEIISKKIEWSNKSTGIKWQLFLKEVKSEMEKGNIEMMDPLNFVLNLFSMIVYPSIAAPLYTQLFSVSERHYRELLKERQSIILRMIFK
jgi:AcrR family transcriptional regulator